MKKLNKISEIIESETQSLPRRDFITYSSMALLGMAAGSLFPSRLMAAASPPPPSTNESTTSETRPQITGPSLSLSHLDGLNLYVTSSSAVPGQPIQHFSEPVDEARYLSQVLFQELIKWEFQYNHYTIANQLGLIANDAMLQWPRVQHIYTLHRDFFSNHMAEYVSSILQSANRTNTNLSFSQRLPSNTWDMAKANQSIDLIEKGFEFGIITDKLYSACLPFCQSEDAKQLSRYVFQDSRWAHELKNHYEQNSVLESLISELRAEDDGLTRFTNAQKKIDGIINKIHILNRAAEYNRISNDELEELEQRMFGVMFSGVALSMRWGSSNESDSVLGRSDSFNEVVDYLRNAQVNGSEETSNFWNSFFDTTTKPTQFWSELAGMGLTNISLRDSITKQKIATKYPELGTSRGTVLLNGFLLLLGISHFSWATVDEDEAVKLTDLGVTFTQTGVSVLYDTLVTRVAWKMVGNSNATSATYFSKFSQFVNKLRGTGNVFSNKVRIRAEKLFNASRIGNIISKVAVALAAIAAVVAVWTLATAIAEGDTAGIVFASLNLVVSVLGLLAMALAWAAPVAVAIAIVGLLLFIAEWLYNLFKPTPPPPNPYLDFTNQVMRPAQLVLGLVGSFLCKTSWGHGAKVSPFDITNMNYDWVNQPHIDASPYYEPKALVTDRRDGYKTIYNFADFQRARKGSVSNFFSQGTSTPINNWSPNYQFRSCSHAVQSIARYSTAAMFAVKVNTDYSNPRLFLSGSFDNCPEMISLQGIDYDRERILDIVAIDNQDYPNFIIFTNKHIYQWQHNENFLLKVVHGYDLDASERDSSLINDVSAFPSGNGYVSFFLNTSLDSYEKIYHFLISENSSNRLFNVVEHIRTTKSMVIEGTSAVSPFNGIAGIHIADSNAPRTYGLACAANVLSRFGTMRADQSNSAQFTCYNDVAFKLSQNVFYGFYKNAFIPA
ncbi:hypothetical protein V9K20_003266 [Vibrio cholerae]|nr:hypothetical protein [Vibrio cholerae]